MMRAARLRSSLVVALVAGLCAGPLAGGAAPAAAVGCAYGTERRPPASPPWAQDALSLDRVDDGFQGWDVTIAVIGSGVDAGHPQLKGHVAPGIKVDNAGDPLTDCLGVGTAAAGAAAAATISGVALQGAAPQALILPVRLPDKMIGTTLDDKELAKAVELFVLALDAAVAADADIVVLPTLELPATQEVRQALSDAVEQGVLLVQGASQQPEPGSFPFSAEEVLGVVGHDSTGAISAEAAKVADDPSTVFDIAAPGIDVMVLTPGAGYSRVDDGGVAAGFVAGAAALLLDAGAARSPEALRERLLDTAETGGGVLPVPVVNPARAMLPMPENGRDPSVGLPDVRPGSPAPGGNGQAAAVMALVSLGLLAATGVAAAAHRRGQAREWAPAPPVDPALIIPPPPKRSI